MGQGFRPTRDRVQPPKSTAQRELEEACAKDSVRNSVQGRRGGHLQGGIVEEAMGIASARQASKTSEAMVVGRMEHFWRFGRGAWNKASSLTSLSLPSFVPTSGRTAPGSER